MTHRDPAPHFGRRLKYPNARAVLELQLRSLEEIKGSCLVALDTNALLVPYKTGKASFQAIRNLIAELSKQGRLVVPGEVVREFADQRASHLAALVNSLSDYRSQQVNPLSVAPLLAYLEEFRAVEESQKKVQEAHKALQQAAGDLLSRARSWTWNDPVSEFYRECLPSNVVDIDLDESQFLEELNTRAASKMPPGYKDKPKDDGGAGDLIIWKTILEHAASVKRDLIFVSSDMKPDWWHQSAGSPLYPRFELVEEFFRQTGGKSFHLLSLASLLELFGRDGTVVEEVRRQEAAVATSESRDNDVTLDLLVTLWLNTHEGIQVVPSGPRPEQLRYEDRDSNDWAVVIVDGRGKDMHSIQEHAYLAAFAASARHRSARIHVVFVARNPRHACEIMENATGAVRVLLQRGRITVGRVFHGMMFEPVMDSSFGALDS